MLVRPLRPEDDRTPFRCGDAALDDFLHRYAGQNQFKSHIAITLVAVDGLRIAGYATIAGGSLRFSDVPKALRAGFPRYPIPVLRLARLAVDVDYQGRGLGRALTAAVLGQALVVRDVAGCAGVVADAYAEVLPFYEALGFRILDVTSGASPARPRTTAMLLRIDDVSDALG